MSRAVEIGRRQSVGAAEAAQLLDQDEELDKLAYYNVACIYAVAVGSAKADDTLSEDARQKLVGEYTEQAIRCLGKAQEAGYFEVDGTVEHLAEDTDFDALREDAAFTEFTSRLRAGGEKPANSADL